MLKKLLSVAVLGIAASATLFTVGCASDSQKPNSLTGNDTTSVQPNSQNPRYLDSKGHYHSEWVTQHGQ